MKHYSVKGNIGPVSTEKIQNAKIKAFKTVHTKIVKLRVIAEQQANRSVERHEGITFILGEEG